MMWCGWRIATAVQDEGGLWTVHLALGTNRGDRTGHLRGAVDGLRAMVEVRALSDVYETAPFGVTDQPPFLNMAVAAATRLEPETLLLGVKALERALGRTASVRMGPREIDIDLLLWGDVVLETELLTIPHPGLMERNFVLRPLLDVAPELRHPVTGERLADRLHLLGMAGVRRLGAAAPILEQGAVR
jgi:2-amino-4-hydroxy-6-hydroxymethyldihydropteridine diphosphokinase